MKSIKESIIGRKIADWIILPNPKKPDLKHLDILELRDGRISICLDPDKMDARFPYCPGFASFDLYNHNLNSQSDCIRMFCVPFYDYNMDLTYNSKYIDHEKYDVIAVYRSIKKLNERRPDFDDIRSSWKKYKQRL